MEFTITHSYPASVETVFKVLTDEDYLREKFEATGATNIEILQCEKEGNVFVIENTREIPANPPGFAKKFIKARNKVIGKDVWDLSGKKTKKGTFEVDVKGIPIRLNGDLTLKPTKNGCDYVIHFNVKVGIPLIGGKIAKLVEEDTRKNQDLDYEYTMEYLENLA